MLMVGHPSRLWGMAIGVNANGRGMATVAREGLRSPVPDRPRPAGRARVLVVGDSSIFGHGVPDHQTLPVQLEHALQGLGVDADVINGGVPGYSSAQSLVLLEELGWSLEPTLLVVANLWSDNNFDLWADADLLHTAAVFAGNPLGGSSLFRLLASGIDRARGGTGAHIVSWTQASGAPDGMVRRVPLEAYATNLDAMARQAASRGVGVAYLGLVNRDLLTERYSEGSWDAYFAAQAAVAAHHGAVRMEARQVLQRAVQEGETPATLFVDELHPSGPAQGRIAQALAEALVEAGWPAEPLVSGATSPFDTTGMLDAWSTQAEGGFGRDSPQRLLLEDKRIEPLAGTGGAPAGPVVASEAWAVSGTIRGPDRPVALELVGAGGRVLASGRMSGPGDFQLTVRGDVEQVTLTVRSGGRQLQAPATRETGPLSLSLD